MQSRDDTPAVEDEASSPGADLESSYLSDSAGKTAPSANYSHSWRADTQPGMLLLLLFQATVLVCSSGNMTQNNNTAVAYTVFNHKHGRDHECADPDQQILSANALLFTMECMLCPGLKAQVDTLQGGQSLQEKRTRMIAQPAAVRISARLLAIKQIATCC